eukprot:1731998-Alexandrium_andersonii.AAC.1
MGIRRRARIGRARHLAVGQLRVQERARPGGFELIERPGVGDPADALTEAVDGETVGEQMSSLGVNWGDGRAG